MAKGSKAQAKSGGTKKKGAARAVGVRTHGSVGQRHVSMRGLAGDLAKGAAGTKHHTEMHEQLAKLPPDAAKHPPRAPVGVLLHDARELLAVAKRTGSKLVKAGMDKRYLAELPTRIALVADAQKAWEKQHTKATPQGSRGLVDSAHQLKTDMLAGGRFVLRHDAAAQRELDAIAEGDGLDDLVADLHALAAFYETRGTALSTAEVPKDAIARARDLAARLAVVAAELPQDHPVHEARGHRNRALVLLDEAVREVRAAGRYVFRAMPARLALFRHDFQRATAARKA